MNTFLNNFLLSKSQIQSQQNRRDFTHLAHFAPGDRTEAGICAKQFQKFNLFKSDCFFIEFLAQSPWVETFCLLSSLPHPLFNPCLLGAHDNSFDIGIERRHERREASRHHARREQVKSSKVQLSGCFDHQLSKQSNYWVNNASVYYLSHVTAIDWTVYRGGSSHFLFVFIGSIIVNCVFKMNWFSMLIDGIEKDWITL